MPIDLPRPSARRRPSILKWGLVAFALLLFGCVGVCVDLPCFPVWVGKGLWLPRCPEGRPVATAALEGNGLRRGFPGLVTVRGEAIYSLEGADEARTTPLRRFRPRLFLVDGAGVETRLQPEDGWDRLGPGVKVAAVRLPDVPDGDYVLRADLKTPLGPVQVEADLPVYAPALVHLATDRPLYKPGQTMKIRAVALRRQDRVPIEGRPGRFIVKDPSGDVMLEERVPAGPWGVAATDFPLSSDADPGTWAVSWISGNDSDTVMVDVEPFTLPRFEVQVRAEAPWSGPGEIPVLRGTVRYRSGAPVVRARVEVQLLDGDPTWPIPADWQDPLETVTDREGAFQVILTPVPDDLHALATVPAYVTVTDTAGEQVSGGAALVLSPDDVRAVVETELADGLVPDFNNRVYVRLTRPDGTPLPAAGVRVRRAWDPADQGVTGVTDADAVAALQLDPGQPVSVVVPPRPYRPPPPSEELRLARIALSDLLAGDPSLDERVVVDGWDPALEPCAARVEAGTERVTLGVAVGEDGRVLRVTHDDSEPARCMADRVRTLRGPSGRDRFYVATWQVEAAAGATLRTSASLVPAAPAGFEPALERGRRRARACVAGRTRASEYPERLLVRVEAGSATAAVRWVEDRTVAGAWSAAERGCLRAAFADLRLPAEASQAAEGVVRVSVVPDPTLVAPAAQQGTVRTAYELEVVATAGEQELGRTRVVVDPGAVPDLRLRPEQAMLSPGDEVRLKVLRGPGFYGELPDEDDLEVPLRWGTDSVADLAWDPERRTLTGRVPEGVHGLLNVEFMGAQAVLLVPRADTLSVAVTPDREAYRPGETAVLAVQTREGEQGVAAALGLFGVDESLGQLAPLLSPDDWGRVTVRATTDRAAFARFDARALLTGRVRGENAVLATLQRITDVGATAAEDEAAYVGAQADVDPAVVLTENFYAVLADVRRRVAAWEGSAPEGEVLTPRRAWGFWEETLKQRRKADLPVEDAYGRRLHLWRLPPDLLALAEPRLLVSDSRRLPEDVENWSAFVAREAP